MTIISDRDRDIMPTVSLKCPRARHVILLYFFIYLIFFHLTRLYE